ncbi:MAG: rhamnulokinase, partial [Anaerolineae bacterium]|nr:rhamnulokinase [Anaerolineae bacterium]
MSERYVIAVDLGAESGRVMRAGFDGQRIEMVEVHRFLNKPVYVRDTLYWNILDLWQNIKDGIEKAADGYEIASIGLDTWGVDVGM